jgi:hypothetical protein
MLFAVNPADNTLSAFGIDSNDPTLLTQLGKATNSQGEFPVALAYSTKHNTLCTVNSGGQSNLACFSVSNAGLAPLTGTVRSLGVNQTNPPTGPANTVSDVLFNQDQTQLLVSAKGDPAKAPGFIASFAVTAGGCFMLSSTAVKSDPQKGVLPFSMTLVGSTGNVLLNTDAAFGVSISNFAANGSIITSSSVALNNQTATCWSTHSPKTDTFFVTDVGRPVMTEVSVGAGPTIQIVKTYTLEGTAGRIDLNVGSTCAGDFLYVLDPADSTIDVFALPGPGAANAIQTFDLKAGVPDIPLSVQGMAVFID